MIKPFAFSTKRPELYPELLQYFGCDSKERCCLGMTMAVEEILNLNTTTVLFSLRSQVKACTDNLCLRTIVMVKLAFNIVQYDN